METLLELETKVLGKVLGRVRSRVESNSTVVKTVLAPRPISGDQEASSRDHQMKLTDAHPTRTHAFRKVEQVMKASAQSYEAISAEISTRCRH